MGMATFFPSSQQYLSVKNGRVIIVTRTKNRPVLLTRAFASMLSQTYNNWHLYLVNDGGLSEPVDELVAQYKGAFNGRITVKHHPESFGMEAASNSALDGAIGDYVIIHDDDDAWCPNFLETTVSFLEDQKNSSFAAVATNCEVIVEEIIGDVVKEISRMQWGFWKERVDLMEQLLTNNFPPICLLIRKPAFDSIGPYNAHLPVLGDWDYNLRILLVGDIGTINAPLAYYHQRKPDAGTYGNSVTDGRNKHLDYQVLYRNSMLRNILAKEPGFAGLLHVLLLRLNQLEQKLNHIHWDVNNSPRSDHLNVGNTNLHHDISALIHTHNQLLRPLRWVWKKFLPLRRMLARLRGRI